MSVYLWFLSLHLSFTERSEAIEAQDILDLESNKEEWVSETDLFKNVE